MEIKTKYNLGDTLYFIKDNQVKSNSVWEINYRIAMVGGGQRTEQIVYQMNSDGLIREQELFLTKEELLKSL